MEVEEHADPHAVADEPAHSRDDVRLAVVDSFAHHRAVQREQHAVDGQHSFELGE